MSEANVASIAPARTMSMFFDKLFGEQTGWVYVPIKKPGKDGAWRKNFFLWPEDKDRMISFILEKTVEHEVYYGPALYKEDCTGFSIKPEHFKGTYYVWAEFDGTLPSSEDMVNVPSPTIKIRSSTAKHEHWYWNLDFLEDNVVSLENITRRLSYALGADLSGWDYTQVLRPPGTIHHESEKLTQILENNSNRVSIERFVDLPDIPNHVWDVEVDTSALPNSLDVLLTHKIPEKELSLFKKKEQPVGKRSSALSRIAHVCVEIGMTNTEMLSVLKWKDNDWGKFAKKGEEGQLKSLVGLIRNIRRMHPETNIDDINENIPWFSSREFLNLDIYVDWLIPGLLTSKSICFISGPSDVGKTKFSYSLAVHMALGKSYLGFEFSRPIKMVIFQMESPSEETQEGYKELLGQFTEEEQEIIMDNLMWVPPGYSINLKYPNIREQLLHQIDKFEPEGILWDSFQTALGGDIMEPQGLNEVFDFIKRKIATERNIFNIFLHHNRKAQIGNKKPKTIDDLLGGQTIVSVATTIFGLWRDNPTDAIIELYKIKSRYARTVESRRMHHKDAYVFELSTPDFVGLNTSMDDVSPYGGIDDDLSIV